MLRVCVGKGEIPARGLRGGLVAAFALAASAAVAAPVEVSFSRIGGGASAVASQFRCVVSDAGKPGTVSFRFTNSSLLGGTVTQVAFDTRNASGLGGLVSLPSQQGAAFVRGGEASVFGNGFLGTTSFADQHSGRQQRGLNAATDYLDVQFNLASGATYDDIVNSLRSGELRIGLLGQNLPNQESEAGFINSPIQIIPLPAAAATSMGLLAVLFVRSNRRRRAV